MAPPPIISLNIRKNIFAKTIYTTTFPFAVDSDAEVDVGAIHKEDYAKIIMEFFNTGGNGVDLTIYGTSMDDGSNPPATPPSPPPEFSTEIYRILDNGIFGVSGISSDARKIADNITWVLIRAKRTTAGMDTLLNIFVRGE